METIILAGGFGTRLQKVVKDLSKPMASINDRPFVEYLMNYLKNYGIKRVILSLGYKHEIIKNHFQNSFNSIEIEYAVEKEALGTGGGIKFAFDLLKGDSALVVNGDTLFNIDLKKFIDFHNNKKSAFSIALRFLDNVERFGTVEIDKQNRIIDFHEKNAQKGKGYINGGVYLINKNFFDDLGFADKFSIEKDCFEKFYKTEKFYGFPADDYFIDIGIPEDLLKAQDDFRRFEY